MSNPQQPSLIQKLKHRPTGLFPLMALSILCTVAEIVTMPWPQDRMESLALAGIFLAIIAMNVFVALGDKWVRWVMIFWCAYSVASSAFDASAHDRLSLFSDLVDVGCVVFLLLPHVATYFQPAHPSPKTIRLSTSHHLNLLTVASAIAVLVSPACWLYIVGYAPRGTVSLVALGVLWGVYRRNNTARYVFVGLGLCLSVLLVPLIVKAGVDYEWRLVALTLSLILAGTSIYLLTPGVRALFPSQNKDLKTRFI